MVDDKKPDLNYDDWDSLPVAPDDDWDDIPLPNIDSSASEGAQESFPSNSNGADKTGNAETEVQPQARSIDLNIDARRPRGAVKTADSINSILADDGNLNEDFDDLVDVSADDVDDIDVGDPSELSIADLTVAEPVAVDAFGEKPAQPVSPEGAAQSEAFEAAEPLAPEGPDGSETVEAFDGINDFKAETTPSSGDLSTGDQNEAQEPKPAYNAHLADDLEDKPEAGKNVVILADEDFADDSPDFESTEMLQEEADPFEEEDLPELIQSSEEDGSAQAETTVSPLPSSLTTDIQDIATQKVELDIEGIFLDDQGNKTQEDKAGSPENGLKDDGASAEKKDDQAKETAVVVVPQPAPVEEPARPGGLKGLLAKLKSLPGNLKNIPKPKLALILLPVLLIMLGMTLGIYKLLFSSKDVSSAALMIIDPTVPPRDAQPGTFDLGVLYVAFPGEPGVGETIAEISFVIHYRDIHDKLSIERQIVNVRDLIYRSALGKGSQLVASGDVQRTLREELAAQLNQVLGAGEHIDYVQIGQIRILR